MLGSLNRFGYAVTSRPTARILALMLAAVCVCVLVGGCGSSGPRPLITQFQPFTPEEQETWAQASAAEYRIRLGDVFDVYFDYYPDLDQMEIVVLPDGRVSLPKIDSLKAAGLTISELDSLITSRYEDEYIDPELSVVVRAFGEIGVYVLGEVYKPGYVTLPAENCNVLQAIALAAGFTGEASTAEILHVRVTPEGYRYQVLDLSHLEKRAFMTPEVSDLQIYDVIYVPQSAMGDIVAFQKSTMSGILSIGDLFWDIYSVTNLHKVNQLIR